MFEDLSELMLVSALLVGGHVVLSSPIARRAVPGQLLADRPGRPYLDGAGLQCVARGKIVGGASLFSASATKVYFLIFITVAASFTTASPEAIWAPSPTLEDGAHGMVRITCHPLMWATGIWPLLHLAAIDSGRAIVFFGAFAIVALFGPLLIEACKATELDGQWQVYRPTSSYIPFSAALSGWTRILWCEIGWLLVLIGAVLYAGALIFEGLLLGVAPVRFDQGKFG